MYKISFIVAWSFWSWMYSAHFIYAQSYSQWKFISGSSNEKLQHYTLPDFSNGLDVKLPHQLNQPNSALWYYSKINITNKGYLNVIADDGAQVWCNQQRIGISSEGLFPIEEIGQKEIIIRVLNNAVSGGLKDVIFQETKATKGALEKKEIPEMQTDKDTVHFNFWGDSQGGWPVFRQIAGLISNENDDFSIGLGDLVGNGKDKKQWEEFSAIIEEIKAKMPLFLLPGNHDYDGYYEDLIPRYYYTYAQHRFSDQTYYCFKWNQGFFIILDPNKNFPLDIDDEQRKWLEEITNAPAYQNSQWKFWCIHQPPYGQGWYNYEGDAFIRNLLHRMPSSVLPDVLLSGHIHDYERLTSNINGRTITFIVSGGAGGSLEPEISNPVPIMDKVIKKHHFGRCSMTKKELSFKIIDNYGQVIDEFQLLNK